MRAPSHSRKTSSARLGIDEFGIAAQTNKPFAKRVLYSRMDVLVAACLSELTQEFDAAWDALAAAHAGDPESQLLAGLHHVADFKTSRTFRCSPNGDTSWRGRFRAASSRCLRSAAGLPPHRGHCCWMNRPWPWRRQLP